MKRFKRMSNKFTVDGKFQPKNPSKYKGDYRNVIYRSSWELTVFKYLDTSPSIIQWSSEEFFVPYKHPFTGRFSRYFPDIWLKYKNKTGTITQTVWEIKPKKYTEPPHMPKRKTKNWDLPLHPNEMIMLILINTLGSLYISIRSKKVLMMGFLHHSR